MFSWQASLPRHSTLTPMDPLRFVANIGASSGLENYNCYISETEKSVTLRQSPTYTAPPPPPPPPPQSRKRGKVFTLPPGPTFFDKFGSSCQQLVHVKRAVTFPRSNEQAEENCKKSCMNARKKKEMEGKVQSMQSSTCCARQTAILDVNAKKILETRLSHPSLRFRIGVRLARERSLRASRSVFHLRRKKKTALGLSSSCEKVYLETTDPLGAVLRTGFRARRLAFTVGKKQTYSQLLR